MRSSVVVALLALSACTSGGSPADPSPATGTTTPAPGWVEVAPMAVARSEHPAVVHDGEMVILGGFVEIGLGRSAVTSEVEAYTPDEDSWRLLPELPMPIHHGMSAVVDGRLFAIGGYSADDDTVDVVWELVGEGWVEREPLPGPLAAAAAVTMDGSVYVVGGFPDSAMYCYDVADDTWTVLPRPGQEREHLAAVVHEGEIWAIAGRWLGEIWDSVEIFDPSTETWRDGPRLNEVRSGFGAATVGDRIIAVGGEVFDPDVALDSVELYEDGEWTVIDPLPYGLHGNPLVSIGSDVYLPGGSTEPAGVENDGRAYRLSLD